MHYVLALLCIIHNILYILRRINNFGSSDKSCCNFNFRRGKGGKKPRSLARQFEGLQVEPADVGPSAPSVDASLNATFSTSVASTPTDHNYSRDRTSIASGPSLDASVSNTAHFSPSVASTPHDHDYIRDRSKTSKPQGMQSTTQAKTMKENVLLNKDTMNETSNAPPVQLTAEWCLQNSGIQWNAQYLPSSNELLASEKELLQNALETELEYFTSLVCKL